MTPTTTARVTRSTEKSRTKQFQRLVTAYIETVTQPSPGLPQGASFNANGHLTYDRIAETTHGPIGLTAYEGWVAGRLPPVEALAGQTFIAGTYRNNYSGKWNWHFDFRLTTPEEAFTQFKTGLQSILTKSN